MTDKVQKIREEVEKIAKSINPFLPDEDGKNSEYEAGRFAMVTQIMQIIDSLQEEPVSGDLEKASDNSDSSLMKHYVTHVLPLCDLVTQRHETRVEEAMANMDAN